MTKNYYVYILTTRNNKLLYIWITNNLIRRIYEHKEKLVEWFTSKYNINKLVYYEETNDVNSAINREKELKWWLRIKKDELINEMNPDWLDLYDEIIKW
jgi:putative endonuclease